MTILTSIILVVAIVVIAAFIAYQMQKGTKPLSEFKADYDNNAEAQEVVELATELYNKDLRPIVAKKETLTKKSKEKIIESITNTGEYVAPKKEKPEFPIDQPAKNAKAIEVSPPAATVNVEVSKPKKKRKYYPKKKKTQE